MKAASHRQQAGVGLVEVLVAVLVLSVGLLGMAGLQLSSMRANASALAKTQATTLAADMLDRMRANRAAAVAGDYDTGFADAHSGSSVAEEDLAEWKVLLARALPEGEGEVISNGALVTVTVRWDEPWADNADGDGHVFVVARSRL
ncbi:MAG: type IV pilus modification protein PilV [Nevskiales bacterium]|nr:type IV pilus modification protein PilV [Nevskiales bacterium]